MLFTGELIVVEVELDAKTMPLVRWFKGKRELKNDARTNIDVDAKNKRCKVSIKKARVQDEGKYTVFLEGSEGQLLDQAKFTIFVKGNAK